MSRRASLGVRFHVAQEEDFNVLSTGAELENPLGKEFDAMASMDEVESALTQMMKTKAGRGQVGRV